MNTIKDLFNALPHKIVEAINNGDCIEEADMRLAFSGAGQVYDMGLSTTTIKNYEKLIKNLIKYIPDNWVDRFIALDRIRKMPPTNHWVSNQELFAKIQKHINKDEFPFLINAMISEFKLKDPNSVYEALNKKDCNAFCDLMKKYDSEKKYQNFIGKCSILLLYRELWNLKLSNPNIITEIYGILKTIIKIFRQSERTNTFEIIDFLTNTKIDDKEKADFLKNDFFYCADFINKVNFQKMEEGLTHQIGLKNKFYIIVDSIETASVEYTEDKQIIKPTKQKSIQKCTLNENQLDKLYDELTREGYIDQETPKELFVKTFSGHEIDKDKRIIFKFNKQYNFKFLIQEMYRYGKIEIKETPPEGIDRAMPSDIFFYTKGKNIIPLKYQRGGYSEESDNAQKERKRIKELINKIRE